MLQKANKYIHNLNNYHTFVVKSLKFYYFSYILT